VLRPLYLSGCDLSFIDCDDNGNLLVETFEKLIKPNTKFFVCTHGSNVTGNIVDVKRLYSLCKANNLTMILDISQTFGIVPVDVSMGDIFCFTGHKGLFGPQGSGGVVVKGNHDFGIVKTGGAGVNTFDTFHSKEMPDIFETGTLNSHSIYGLQKGLNFINEIGIDKIHEKEDKLLNAFYKGIKDIPKIKIYGDFSSKSRLPIVSITLEDLDSSELAEKLWIDHNIATRAGGHCAPLLHKRFGTVDVGMVRFSFSYFNTFEEIEKGIVAIRNIAKLVG